MSPVKAARQRGVAIPLLAMFIVVLFAVAALAIDVGLLYTARTSAQHAADAAALAGAFTFLDLKNVQPDAAVNAAIAVAGSNSILGEPVAIQPANVDVNAANRRVTVTVPRIGPAGISTFFARVLGVNRVDVQTQATAETSKYASGAHCLKPIAVANTVLSQLPPDKACAAGETLFDAQGNVTGFAMNQFGQSAVTLMPGDAEGNSRFSNQFLPLDFGGDEDNYEVAFSTCLNDPSCGANSTVYSCATPLDLRDNADPQDTFKGVTDLIGTDQDLWGGAGPNGGFQYVLANPAGTVADTSHALGGAAVWDNCAIPQPGKSLQPIGFVQLFFEGVNLDTGTITAHVVSANACGPLAPGDGTGPYAVPVRLVQRPQPE